MSAHLPFCLLWLLIRQRYQGRSNRGCGRVKHSPCPGLLSHNTGVGVEGKSLCISHEVELWLVQGRNVQFLSDESKHTKCQRKMRWYGPKVLLGAQKKDAEISLSLPMLYNFFFNWREMNKETTPSRCGLLIFWVYLVLLTRVCETYRWLQHSRKKINFPVAIINPWRGMGIWEPLSAAEIESNRKGVTQNLSRCLWRGPFFSKQSLPLPNIWQPWWFSPT